MWSWWPVLGWTLYGKKFSLEWAFPGLCAQVTITPIRPWTEREPHSRDWSISKELPVGGGHTQLFGASISPLCQRHPFFPHCWRLKRVMTFSTVWVSQERELGTTASQLITVMLRCHGNTSKAEMTDIFAVIKLMLRYSCIKLYQLAILVCKTAS